MYIDTTLCQQFSNQNYNEFQINFKPKLRFGRLVFLEKRKIEIFMKINEDFCNLGNFMIFWQMLPNL